MTNERIERTEMNSFEWCIYNFIKERSEKGLWTTQVELNEHLIANGYETTMRNTRTHLQFIRKNDKIQKIILSHTKKGYKLLSDEEEERYIVSKLVEAVERLQRAKKDLKKLRQNGQCRITFGKYERNYIESVLKEV